MQIKYQIQNVTIRLLRTIYFAFLHKIMRRSDFYPIKITLEYYVLLSFHEQWYLFSIVLKSWWNHSLPSSLKSPTFSGKQCRSEFRKWTFVLINIIRKSRQDSCWVLEAWVQSWHPVLRHLHIVHKEASPREDDL